MGQSCIDGHSTRLLAQKWLKRRASSGVCKLSGGAVCLSEVDFSAITLSPTPLLRFKCALVPSRERGLNFPPPLWGRDRGRGGDCADRIQHILLPHQYSRYKKSSIGAVFGGIYAWEARGCWSFPNSPQSPVCRYRQTNPPKRHVTVATRQSVASRCMLRQNST